ncbi:MAG: cadherin-like domain-containing protein [Trueperaceae bacterium]|nr:cadherin-like domain-containing protein [Trueperaceae bacterium]
MVGNQNHLDRRRKYMRQTKLFAVFLGLLLFVAACTTPTENTAPVAKSQTVNTEIGKAVTITLGATDAESNPLTFKVTVKPSNGTVSDVQGNKVSYTPKAGFTGADSFKFIANDGTVDSSPATVTINVNAAGNNPPAAKDATVSVAPGQSVSVTLEGTDADGDALTYTLGTASAGTVKAAADFATSHVVTYTAAADAKSGSKATFTFTVADGKGGSDEGTITVNIVASSGSVTDDSYSTIVNTLLEAGGIANEGNAAVTDKTNITANDAVKTVTAVGNKATEKGGTVRINANGTFRYTPAKDFVGLDTFTYSASTGDTATVTVQVVEANPAVDGNQVVVYVKQGATGGDGTASKPLGSLLAAMAASKEGDTIVLYAGTYVPADNGKFAIQLKSNQKLLGQEVDVNLLGQVVLKASTTVKTILSRPENVSISLTDVDDSNKKDIKVNFQANNVTISGLTINRADATGTKTADTSKGSGATAIITSDQMTGTLTITDVNILYPGGYGLLVQETDRCPHVNCDPDYENLGPVGTATANYNLVMKRVQATGAGNSSFAINDPISVDIDASSVVGVGAKEVGFRVESEHVSKVKITNSTVTSNAINSTAFEFFSNNNFGRTAEKAVMTVELADNLAKFVLNATNDVLMGDPPVAGADGRVDGSIGFRGRVLDNWDDQLKVISVSPGSSQVVITGTSSSEAADSPRACENREPPYDAAIPTPVTCGAEFLVSQP